MEVLVLHQYYGTTGTPVARAGGGGGGLYGNTTNRELEELVEVVQEDKVRHQVMELLEQLTLVVEEGGVRYSTGTGAAEWNWCSGGSGIDFNNKI